LNVVQTREQMERKLQKMLSVPITEGTHYIVELFPGSHLIVTSIKLQKVEFNCGKGKTVKNLE
jgi:hypothetical protein